MNPTPDSSQDIIKTSLKVSKLQGYIAKTHYQFRICLIGDSFVGKTSLMKRYYEQNFNEDYLNTVGCDFKVVSLEVDMKAIKLQIWDTAGQERFKAISVNYFRSAHGFIFVFDITKKESLVNIENWINTAFGSNKNNLYNILIGNKSDLSSSREVSQEEAVEFAMKYEMPYLETSAKENENVDVMFHYLAYMLMDKYNKDPGNSKDGRDFDDENLDGIDLKAEKKKGCCS